MSTIQDRANRWVISGRTGMSSKSLWAWMQGVPQRDPSHPYDPADLQRCLLLLEDVPEWKERMPEMAALSPEWKALTERWDEISAAFIREVGGVAAEHWRAPETYRLMSGILLGARKSQSVNAKMGEGR